MRKLRYGLRRRDFDYTVIRRSRRGKPATSTRGSNYFGFEGLEPRLLLTGDPFDATNVSDLRGMLTAVKNSVGAAVDNEAAGVSILGQSLGDYGIAAGNLVNSMFCDPLLAALPGSGSTTGGDITAYLTSHVPAVPGFVVTLNPAFAGI